VHFYWRFVYRQAIEDNRLLIIEDLRKQLN